MINNRDRFVYNIVDDLSIGHFIAGLNAVEYVNWSSLAEYYGQWNPNKIVFFNNTNKVQRDVDVLNHRIITNNIKL